MILLVVVFLSTVFLIFMIYYIVEYQRGQWKFRSRMAEFDKEGIESIETTRDNFFTKALKWLGSKIQPKDVKEISNLKRDFLRAGFRKDISLIFFGLKILLAFAIPVVFFIVKASLFKTMPVLVFTLLVCIFALIGFYIPTIWIKNKIAHRRESIFRSFPDALDLMVVCVQAGTSLDAAIQKVGEELSLGSKALSNELKILSLELRAGMSRREALQNLAMRCDLDDVSSLVTLLIQTDKFGTSVAQALKVYSSSMRTTRQQRAEEAAAKLPVKMIFPMMFFIFPSLFVVLVGSSAIRIFQAFSTMTHK